MCKVSISNGNSKVGNIKSVSLPPIISCVNCPCAKDCYAVKLKRIYPSVDKAWTNNWNIYSETVEEYFNQINQVAKMERYFRWHVSGDIVNYSYFENMVAIAKKNRHCKFLAFTKNYKVVNDWITENGKLPSNLKIIFSEWKGLEMPNPYKLPTSHVIFKGDEINEKWLLCGGNCEECACKGVGCWQLRKGQTIAFNKH